MNIQRGKKSPTGVWILSRKGKAGRSYHLRWVDPRTGKTKQESCGRDLAYARLNREAKREQLRSTLSGCLPDKSIGDLKESIPVFMAGKSPHTIRKCQCALGSVVNLCEDRLLVHLDRGMMMEFRAVRLASGVRIATVNKEMRTVKSALSYAVDAGWLETNPLWRWKGMLIREPEKRVRVVESWEFSKLLEACENPTFRVLMIVAYYLGLRRSELAHLRWTAVDLERGIMHVENVVESGELTKSRKNRSLPMPAIVRSELQALQDGIPKVVSGAAIRPKHPHCFTWEDGKPYRPDWVTVEFARVADRSAVDHCTIHDFRRSFSTLAQRAGVDKATVKDLGGWSTIGVVEKHYTGEVPEALKQAMDRIELAHGVA